MYGCVDGWVVGGGGERGGGGGGIFCLSRVLMHQIITKLIPGKILNIPGTLRIWKQFGIEVQRSPEIQEGQHFKIVKTSSDVLSILQVSLSKSFILANLARGRGGGGR